MSSEDPRTEAALYWSAVSLIVCEGLSIEKAAEQLCMDEDRLRDIMHQRQCQRVPAPPLAPIPMNVTRLSVSSAPPPH